MEPNWKSPMVGKMVFGERIRILLDEAGEVAELGDGRRRDRVNRRVVERHMAVSGFRAIDPEVRPGPVDFNRTHVELLRWIGSHYFRLKACRSRRWIFRPGASRCPILSTRHVFPGPRLRPRLLA